VFCGPCHFVGVPTAEAGIPVLLKDGSKNLKRESGQSANLCFP
jgi:hypothetical protein